MHDILFDLIREGRLMERDHELLVQSMPDYAKVKAQLDHSLKVLQSSLGDQGQDIYLDFEAAHNAMGTMDMDASLRLGIRLCVKLLIELLTL